MTMTADPEEFRERWKGYLDGLDRLRLALDEEQAAVLDDATEQIERVIDAAADREVDR